MLRIQKIESLDLPELQPYRTMRRQIPHEEQGIFVAEGDKVVRRLLESDFGIVSVLFPEKWLDELKPLLDARHEKDIPVFIADKLLLEQLTGFSMYQGVLAVGKIPETPSLKKIVADSPRPKFFVAVDGLADAENLGAVVRNCVAFGVQAMLVGETSSSPFLRRAVRTSMGTIFKLPVIELGHRRTEFHDSPTESGRRGTPPSETLAKTVRELRKHGVRSIAAHPHADGKILSQANFTGDCCVVFGSEGLGVSAEVLDACDEAVAIPMQAGVDSLNVASATSVFLYEASRQRGKS